MIWLHIGMPKSGSSSLQDFLSKRTDILSRHNVHYVRTGRHNPGKKMAALPSHNTLAKQMIENWQGVDPALFDHYVEELAEHSDKACVISAEMFHGHRLAPLQDKIFSRIDQPVNVVIYLRRFSDFLESDYKQKAKKGRQFSGAERYAQYALRMAESSEGYMNYSETLRLIGVDIPNAIIHPRIFLRDQLVNGDVIHDFLSLTGVSLAGVDLPASISNKSLSRIASEALGLFATKDSPINKIVHRRIDAELQHSKNASFFSKGDVFLPDEARALDEILEAKSSDMLERYFPGDSRIFPKVDSYHGKYLRGDADELQRFKDAICEILRMIKTMK